MHFRQEILKSIQVMINEKISTYRADRTFVSVVRQINSNGTYVVSDENGSERDVRCCIPNVDLKVGQRVYVKLPSGDLKKMHICGVI